MVHYIIRVSLAGGGPLYDLCVCESPEKAAALLVPLMHVWDWTRGPIEIAPRILPPPWEEGGAGERG